MAKTSIAKDEITMETAVAKQSGAKKKSQPVTEELAETPSSLESELGSSAGMPLFLQRSALSTVTGSEAAASHRLESRSVQAKLLVGAPNDEYEQEADQIAASVTHTSTATNLSVSQHGAETHLQRRCAECEDEDRIQTKTTGSAPASPSLPPALPLPNLGEPLPVSVREKIEPVLNADLSHVQIHRTPDDQVLAQKLSAKAFTHKHHIWLGPSQSPDDVELMAHEATHVVQQQSAPPPLIQRKPADYQHPEDGSEVRQRMQQKIAQVSGHSSPATAASVAPPAPSASPTTPDQAAQQAVNNVDRTEVTRQTVELQPQALPSVDRPAEQQPQVAAAASVTQETADTPTDQLEQGEADGQGEGGSKVGDKQAKAKQAMGEAEQAANMADQAFSVADSQAMPTPETPVVPPPPVSPVDAAGMPLLNDPESDLQVLDLANRAQILREEGHRIRLQAAQENSNAGLLQGNIELVRAGVGQAKKGVEKSSNHLAFRQELVGQAKQALTASEQKAAMVAEQAPTYVAKANEGKEDSGPMSSEAGQMVAENNANTPSDSEAAAKSQEQGSKMTQAGADIASTDSAISQAQNKAQGLGEEAAQATQLNTQTQGKIGAIDETLTQTNAQLAQMMEQNNQARMQVEGMATQPAKLTAQANVLDQQGLDLIQASMNLESQLQRTQTSYQQGMQAVLPVKMLGTTEEPADEQVMQMAPDATAQPVEPSAEAALPTAIIPQEVAPEPTGEGRYEDRSTVDVTGSVTGALPSWLTGVDPVSEAQREQARLAEEDRRQTQIDQINEMAGGQFENLSAADKAGIALRLTGRNLFGSVGNIKWPGWGHLAAGLIDPRGPLMGVVSGLSMMLSGGANLFSSQQWSRDPLGNLLKSAADIATGLTIILGSITALAGVVIAIMAAITILSLGTAAPVTGPVIAFCTSVLTTVGGWTIAVGKVALVLQALVFIKNLIDAATAKTAGDLQNQADQMTQDVSNAGNVVMQIGMAKLAQVGGRAAASEIQAAGGGVRYAAGMGARFATGARALPGRIASGTRALPGQLVRGGRAIGSAAKTLPGRLAGGARAVGSSVRALPGRLVSGARSLPGRIAQVPGQLVRGARGLPGRLRGQISREFSRDFIIGEDIASLGGAKAATAETRAAVFAEASEARAVAGETVTAESPRPREAAEVNSVPPERDVHTPSAAEPIAPKREEGLAVIDDAPPESAPAREASIQESSHIESDQLSSSQLQNEIDHIENHPEMLEGTPPNRTAKMGDHQWREQPGGRWCRHSDRPVCVMAFDETRLAMRAEDPQSLVRRIGESDEVYRTRLQQAQQEARESLARANAHTPRTPERQRLAMDEVNNRQVYLQEIDDRLSQLEDRMASSQSSLRQPQLEDNWTDTGFSPRRAGDPINPRTMSDADIQALLNRYRIMKGRSDITRRIEWLEHEQTFRQTQGQVRAAETNYPKLTAGATTIDDVDRQLVFDAITNPNHSGHLWVSSQEQAERIFHTLDEMTRKGTVITRRPPNVSTSGQRPDLPFRGPEYHPFPDRGSNQLTHFNAEIVYQGRSINLHIYWSSTPL
jgi:Domain of unknown function (DUF4157)